MTILFWMTILVGMTILINFPLAAFVDKALGVYFEQAAVFTGHLNHVGKRVHFGNAEVGAVVEDVNSFVRQVAAGFVVPVKFVGKAAEKASTLT